MSDLVTVVGINPEKFSLMINREMEYRVTKLRDHLYGAGNASKKIVGILQENSK
jgi:UDP-N-acetylglucosamine 2-epimerase